MILVDVVDTQLWIICMGGVLAQFRRGANSSHNKALLDISRSLIMHYCTTASHARTKIVVVECRKG